MLPDIPVTRAGLPRTCGEPLEPLATAGLGRPAGRPKTGGQVLGYARSDCKHNDLWADRRWRLSF